MNFTYPSIWILIVYHSCYDGIDVKCIIHIMILWWFKPHLIKFNVIKTFKIWWFVWCDNNDDDFVSGISPFFVLLSFLPLISFISFLSFGSLLLLFGGDVLDDVDDDVVVVVDPDDDFDGDLLFQYLSSSSLYYLYSIFCRF